MKLGMAYFANKVKWNVVYEINGEGGYENPSHSFGVYNDTLLPI
jgi:hypothetical protein